MLGGQHQRQFQPRQPWAILGIICRQYAAAKPWKKAGESKQQHHLPHEASTLLREGAEYLAVALNEFTIRIKSA